MGKSTKKKKKKQDSVTEMEMQRRKQMGCEMPCLQILLVGKSNGAPPFLGALEIVTWFEPQDWRRQMFQKRNSLILKSCLQLNHLDG